MIFFIIFYVPFIFVKPISFIGLTSIFWSNQLLEVAISLIMLKLGILYEYKFIMPHNHNNGHWYTKTK